MCNDIFKKAFKTSKHCPVQLIPHCHPKSHLDVHIDGKRRKVTLSCSKCDKPIAIFNFKKDGPARLKGNGK